MIIRQTGKCPVCREPYIEIRAVSQSCYIYVHKVITKDEEHEEVVGCELKRRWIDDET